MDLYSILGTALIPLASFTSVSIYLFTHPASPLDRYLHKVQLPVHKDEGLDGRLQEDPFDFREPDVYRDGDPVQEGRFWTSTWRKKVAFLCSLILPIGCSVVQLAMAVDHLDGEDLTRAILPPLLVIPSFTVTFALGLAYLSQSETKTHWNTTIHLAVNVTVQFLVLATLGLLPSQPFPGRTETVAVNPSTESLLPILTIPSVLIILSVRRGPPLHFPPEKIYPSRITEAIPSDADGINPEKPNVSEEVQATIPDWLLFSYATNVVKRGSTADTTDVWDLPVLHASMREFLTIWT